MIANLELLYTTLFLVSLAGASACLKIRLSGSKEWIAKENQYRYRYIDGTRALLTTVIGLKFPLFTKIYPYL